MVVISPNKTNNHKRALAMSILTQICEIEKNKILIGAGIAGLDSFGDLDPTPDSRLLAAFKKMGFVATWRTKKLEFGHRTQDVPAYAVRNPTNGRRATVYTGWSSAHRPYPAFVYIFAVVVYTLLDGASQRFAADLTKAAFGLATFDHSTLGRALKHFAKGCGCVGADGPAGLCVDSARLPDNEWVANEVEAALADRGADAGPRHVAQPGLLLSMAGIFASILCDWIARLRAKAAWTIAPRMPQDALARFVDAANSYCRLYFRAHRKLLL